MNEIINIMNHEGHLVVTSRQIAEDFEKEHKNITRDIDALKDTLNFEQTSKLFIQSEYKDSMNRNQKEYLLTRDGFSLLVMGFTGQKALEWKLKYIEAFNKMEQELKKQQPSCIEDIMIQSLQEMKAVKLQINAVSKKVIEADKKAEAVQNDLQSMRDVYTLSPNAWRMDTSKLISAIALKIGGFDHIKQVREESYRILDERAGARLGIRLANMKKNVLVETGSRAKSEKVTKVDVIAADKRLVEVYCLIVKEMAIKYNAA